MTSKPRLNIIIASTRPGRVGPRIGEWIDLLARSRDDFETSLIDLAEFQLPVYDESHLPKNKNYEHQHTIRWARSVDSADAFVFVVPEYNAHPTPALVNALHFLFHEWNYKAVGFVSYAYASGGLRGVQELKPLMLTLKLVPLVEQVMIPMFHQHLSTEGKFEANAVHTQAAETMLDELSRWTTALKTLRA
ncbi:NADPH-dependent FMN reductase [Achromobacter sp. UMC71]|uniref:NADPH-dependent FMN reductase n=1 Tax=Achromobacter sp. UMC71 TaxID=1862320 RepID=UPI001600C1DE|nr:NAD(P)H-dependent oxidoreductase [Achromobacter sp. UMC71]MBB1628341.1 NADPH-dependent FMN reductase [Achromobacter sp. UMC71]